MTQQKHVHQLKRHRYRSGREIYFCTLPDCTHKIDPAFAVGKRSICNRCGEEFLLSEYSVRLAKPHCDKCHKSKSGKTLIIMGDIPAGIPEVQHALPMVGMSDTANDLRSRLNQVTHKEEEDDI